MLCLFSVLERSAGGVCLFVLLRFVGLRLEGLDFGELEGWGLGPVELVGGFGSSDGMGR